MKELLGLGLKRGTWDEARAWIGRDIARVVGADQVNRADVRRKLEVFQFASPLNTDDAFAQQFGYEAAPALTTMLSTWGLPPYWSPGEPAARACEPHFIPYAILQIPAPGNNIFATNFSTEYFEPVYPGDWISSVTRLISVTEKKTRVGEGAFMTVETTYINQNGAVCGVERVTAFRYAAEEVRT